MLISDVLGAKVADDDGRELGRVYDVRVEKLLHRTPDGHRLKVVGLVVGQRGIRERLGLDTGRTSKPKVERDLIPWDHVLEVDAPGGRVRVRRA
jgi:sporulation protein YlmC with PRC-barrel domain